MKDIKDYEEYKKLFEDDLVIAVRNVLKKIEDGNIYELEDSDEHNELIEYFNKFGLHKEISEEKFNSWKK